MEDLKPSPKGAYQTLEAWAAPKPFSAKTAIGFVLIFLLLATLCTALGYAEAQRNGKPLAYFGFVVEPRMFALCYSMYLAAMLLFIWKTLLTPSKRPPHSSNYIVQILTGPILVVITVVSALLVPALYCYLTKPFFSAVTLWEPFIGVLVVEAFFLMMKWIRPFKSAVQ